MNLVAGLRIAALTALLALALCLALWFRDQPLWVVVLIVPLALPLHGLWQGKRYTYAWCSLLMLLYLGLGITEAIASPATRAYAYAALLASAIQFVSCLLYVRMGMQDTRSPRA